MRTVLVVDDDVDCRGLIGDVLGCEGYRVAFAGDGCEALAALAQEPLPDAILLDLAMPHMTGWRFRDLQKREPRLAGIPVLVMTATRPLGVDAEKVLEKPFPMGELVRWLRRVAPVTPAQAARARLHSGA